MEKQSFKLYLKERLKNRAFITIVIFYILLCFASTLFWCFNMHTRNILMSIVFMLFIPLIFIAEHIFKLRFSNIFTSSILFLAIGAIAGSCFNVYTILPFFDTLLHGLSGILFGCLGFAFAEKFFGKAKNKKTFFGCLSFGICFSLAIALVWELFEYTCTTVFGLDMMEDAYVSNINSYLLAGSHNETMELNNIVKTIIYYDNGKIYQINGYLDLGLIDTLTDMTICFAGAIVFGAISTFSFFKLPKINSILIPQTKININQENL